MDKAQLAMFVINQYGQREKLNKEEQKLYEISVKYLNDLMDPQQVQTVQ